MLLPDRLSPNAANQFVEALPSHIREAVLAYSEETEYPVEAVLEMAIAFFLDMDSMGFDDCRAETPGQLRNRLEMMAAIMQRNQLEVPDLPH